MAAIDERDFELFSLGEESGVRTVMLISALLDLGF